MGLIPTAAACPAAIELVEGQPRYIPRTDLAETLAAKIFQSRLLEVEFPSPVNAFQYRLLSTDIVGQIPIGSGVLLRITPKVHILNIFRMLEVAYQLKSFQWREGSIDVRDLPDLFERLVSILARRVLDRGRKGLYRSYLDRIEDLPLVRGRVDVRETSLLFEKGIAAIRCEFQEHTGDIDDNQILHSALTVVSRMSLVRQDVRREVSAARRLMQGAASLRSVSASECAHRVYNQLNSDYQPLHALSRFILEHTGPSIALGDKSLIPFTVDMPALFELFVSEWLRIHAPPNLLIKAQHTSVLDPEGTLSWRVDIVIYDRLNNRCVAVLDTKYKAGDQPLESDIQQVVAYAVKMDAKDACLVYPSSKTRSIDISVGAIRVRSVAFSLDGDLDAAGRTFLGGLVGETTQATTTTDVQTTPVAQHRV